MSTGFRLRVAALRLRAWLLYAWRRGELSQRFPLHPEPDYRRPLPPIDTGGGTYRATFGSQFSDPTEAHTSPHSEGENCTMAAAGMGLGYHRHGSTIRGGDMRHRQGDSSGGTDLYDAAQAWAAYGESLSIRSGQGWGAVVDALEGGRGVIAQGTGGLGPCGDYMGGHAIYIAPESSGSRWLKGDPECSGYEWTEASALKAWMMRLSSGCYFAVTKAYAPPPPPAPEPDCPDCPPAVDFEAPGPELRKAEALGGSLALDDAVTEWVGYLSTPKLRGGLWDAAAWADECPAPDDAIWSVGLRLPDPLAAARHALATPPLWDSDAWRGLLWGSG